MSDAETAATLANIVQKLDRVAGVLDHLQSRLDRLERRQVEFWNRYTTNLGHDRVATNTRAGLTMFIDPRDTGSGFNIIDSGHIEPHVAKAILKSTPFGGTFLDIGSNFGYYATLLASNSGRRARVHAFEANPHLVSYITGSAYVNGVSSRLSLHNLAVSDAPGTLDLAFDFHAIGGGALVDPLQAHDRRQVVSVRAARIDDVLPPDLVVDCAKLDVEGSELPALLGMRGAIARSPDIRLIIEFFPGMHRHEGNGADLLRTLRDLGLSYWTIDARGHLVDVTDEQLVSGGDCYLLAAREKPDLTATVLPHGCLHWTRDPASLTMGVQAGEQIFHGPYIYLPSGVYDLELVGLAEGQVSITAAEEFGQPMLSTILSPERRVMRFAINRDVRYFEVVARAVTGAVSLDQAYVRLHDVI